MILDNEQQRKFLLEMMKGVNFPGAVLEDAYELKQAVLKATIGAPPAPPVPTAPAPGLLTPGQGD
jgi:hypothetical protein